MTNHGETTGPFEDDDVRRSEGGHRPRGHERYGGGEGQESHGAGERRDDDATCARRISSGDRIPFDGADGAHNVTLRTPAELADALPYLLGYRPEDSIVLVTLHDRGGRGRFGGRARLGIPRNPDDWLPVAAQLAHGLVTGSARRGNKPEQMVAYLCQEPGKGETGRQVMERLRPLAQNLRVECGLLDVPVIEALCISDGRFWSYCCGNERCCPAEGLPMGLPGTSVLAAAATYAGIQVRGTLRELRARLLPWETAAVLEQESALDAGSVALVPRMLDESSRPAVGEETLRGSEEAMLRLAAAAPVSGALMADLRDDELIGNDEAARLILGLQDRTTRDRAAEWMEGDEAGPALRLWRALARRCVGPYGEHAAAPLTLAGWVAWSTGDDLEAREALAMALGADPDYLFARLLHQAINEGLDPESIRRCLRTERENSGHWRPGVEQTDGVQDSCSTESRGVDGGEPMRTQAAVMPPRQNRPARASADAAHTDSGSPEAAAPEAAGDGTAPALPRTRRRRNTGPGVGRSGGTRPRTSGKAALRRRGAHRGGVAPGGSAAPGDM
ncbi:DUF4192 domain-containing protein [Streptomyces cadmiisoli]|uniref:DUF4192 domain-containing protein n=1 Tax=Streptomyces cadmiisoli TaxID=2184053 RepID=UPI003D72D7BD